MGAVGLQREGSSRPREASCGELLGAGRGVGVVPAGPCAGSGEGVWRGHPPWGLAADVSGPDARGTVRGHRGIPTAWGQVRGQGAAGP